MLSRLTDQLAAQNVKVLLFALDDSEQLEHILEQIWTYQIDGVIALTAHFDYRDIAQFEQQQIPVVLYNRQVLDHPVNTVSVDHEQGIR